MKFKDVVPLCENLKILFVEDDKGAREATVSFLNNFFHYIDIAIDGEDGLNKYKDYYESQSRYYDLIITDLRMPKMSGKDMIIAMNSINEHQAVIVISAYHESSDLIELIQLGITNFVLKPIQSKQLIQILYTTCKSISTKNSLVPRQRHITLDNTLMMDISQIIEYSRDLVLLYVEENRDIRDENHDIFKNIFADVIVAKNGQEGLERFVNHHKSSNKYPNIVITDIDTSHEDGIEMSREIFKLNPKQMLVVLSFECTNQQLQELLNMNVYKFILKPITFQDFYSELIDIAKVSYENSQNILRDKEIKFLKNTISELQDNVETEKYNMKIKDNFFANMSHEIRTPMNAIIGLSHILLETKIDDIQYDYISKIQKSGDLLLEIINDILDFSKIEAGKLDIEFIDFNLNEVLENVSSMINVKVEEKSLEFIFDIDKGVPFMLKGDPLRLGQVLINLLNNAVKFTERGSIILEIKALDNINKLEFRVIDTGIGIKEKQISNLFQSFSQADGSTSRNYGGSGLGLTISKQLVEMMGGDIRVESEYGVGSEFIFTIEAKRQESVIDTSIPLIGFRDKDILVIDSSLKTLKVLSAILEQFNLNITMTETIDNLIDTLSDKRFDIVFIDYNLMLECKDDILKSNCNTKVVVIKSGISLGTEMTINSVNISAYIPKPFTKDVVAKVLLSVITGKKIPKVKSELAITKAQLAPLKGKKIILAEDNKINQLVITALLSNTDIDIKIADNGKEVLAHLDKSCDVDLILMDLQMPIMNGYEAVRKIKESGKYDDIKIIALTASTLERDIKKIEEAKINEHISKPINVSFFYSILLKYMLSENKTVVQNRVIPVDFIERFQISIYEFEGLIELLQFDRISSLLVKINDDAERINIFEISSIVAKVDIVLKEYGLLIEAILENFKEIFDRFIISSDKIKNRNVGIEEDEQLYISKILNIDEAIKSYNSDILLYRANLFSYSDKFRGVTVLLKDWILEKEFLSVKALLSEIKKDSEEIKAKYIIVLVLEFETIIENYKGEMTHLFYEYKNLEKKIID